jgi:hypothetical protein
MNNDETMTEAYNKGQKVIQDLYSLNGGLRIFMLMLQENNEDYLAEELKEIILKIRCRIESIMGEFN